MWDVISVQVFLIHNVCAEIELQFVLQKGVGDAKEVLAWEELPYIFVSPLFSVFHFTFGFWVQPFCSSVI